MKFRIYSIFLSLIILASLIGCNGMPAIKCGSPNGSNYYRLINEDTDQTTENKFISVSENAISTFSADVDTASYTYFRKLVDQGHSLSEIKSLAKNSMRTEEMVNYFAYNYTTPKENELFGVSTETSLCPWNNENILLVLGLSTEKASISIANNLVFLIDVSGSMDSPDKLSLLKKSFSYLVDKLDENDTISIVTYAGDEEVVLTGCTGNKSETIMNAVNSLSSGGSTNGEAGLQKAYSIAEDYFIEGGNNRIIMASDGDLNVGISSAEELTSYISEKRKLGVYLSVLGFGTGNYNDSNMEALADNGNGVYYYIDSELEAEKVFGNDIFSTLHTVAEDVKLQITFNKDIIESYRLIGYENRLLENEDFDDDTKDAGEIGAGHSVTVCYELKLKEKALENENKWFDLAVKYKKPGGIESILNEYTVGKDSYTTTQSDDFKFISAVIETSMILRDSEYINAINFNHVLSILEELDLSEDEYKNQFVELIKKIK